MSNTPFKPVAVSDDLRRRILEDANYGGHPDGQLDAREVEALHLKVGTAMSTMDGDASHVVVTARELAILLRHAIE